MKKVDRFINEISKEVFATKEEAVASENRSKDIQTAFSFYYKMENKPKDGNDEIGVQRTEEFYYKLVDTLIDMVKKYEPWILESYKKAGGLTRELTKGYSMLGRFLDDGDSDLYHWWCVQGYICPKCFREYGQMFFALNCGCK